MVSQNLGNFHNNNDKVVVKVTKELERFKQVFFRLIDKAQGKLNQLEAQRKVAHDFDDYQIKLLDIECDILSDLVKIYKEFVNSYVVELVLFEWPKLSLSQKNRETLSNLYMITFTKLQEIQERLAQIILPILYSLDDEDSTLNDDGTKDEEKAIDMLHSRMFGGSLFKPIPPFEHKLVTFEREFLQHY
jgi:hypothetical protein